MRPKLRHPRVPSPREPGGALLSCSLAPKASTTDVAVRRCKSKRPSFVFTPSVAEKSAIQFGHRGSTTPWTPLHSRTMAWLIALLLATPALAEFERCQRPSGVYAGFDQVTTLTRSAESPPRSPPLLTILTLLRAGPRRFGGLGGGSLRHSRLCWRTCVRLAPSQPATHTVAVRPGG